MSKPTLPERARDLAVHALRVAAAEAIVQEEGDDAHQSQRIADLLDDLASVVDARPLEHVIQFDSDGAVVMHPLIGCGANLFDCPASFTSHAEFALPPTVGRYRLTVGANGSLHLGEEVE